MKKLTGFISSGLLFFFFLIFGIAASSGMKLEFRLFGGRVPTWLPWTFAAFCLLGAIVTLMDYLANKLVITSHRTILYRGGEPIAISHENMGEIVVNTELDVNDTFSPQKHSITIQSLVEGEEAIHLDNASADIAMIQQLLEEVKVSTTRSKQLPGKSGNAPGGLDEIPVLETVSSSASHPARPETQPSPKPIQRSLLLSPEPREDEIVYLRSRFSIHGSAQPCDLFLTDQRLFVVKHSLLSRPVVILQCLLAEMRGVKITETMITCQLSENAKSLVIVKHPLYAIHDPKVLINMLNCALIVGYERKLTKQDDSWVVKRVKMGADKKRKAIEELEESEEYYARVSFMNRVTPRQLILFALYTIGGLLLLVILILIAAGLSSGSKTSVIPQ